MAGRPKHPSTVLDNLMKEFLDTNKLNQTEVNTLNNAIANLVSKSIEDNNKYKNWR